MKKTFPLSLGMTVGAFAGFVHVVWSVMAAAGWAQAWVNWVAKLHFTPPPVRVTAFDLGTAIVLVIVTTFVGFVAGYIFGTLWTAVRK